MTKPIVHLVTAFVAGVGKTECGQYSNNVTAYREGVTCRKCTLTAQEVQ